MNPKQAAEWANRAYEQDSETWAADRGFSYVLFSKGSSQAIVGYSQSRNLTVVAFRGTEFFKISDLKTNLRSNQINGKCTRGKVHEGYHDAAWALIPAIKPALKGKVDLLVSNPPYIRREEIEGLPPEVSQHDPREALDGGSDGLNHYRALAAGLSTWLSPGGSVAVEIGFDQGAAVKAILARGGCRDIVVVRDYNDLPRVVTARYGSTGQLFEPGEG